ncbi:RNA-binding S4 domain-containing protein [Sphingobium algorifonticola]|uniref:RNA-binding S4 domain-containing protein n=1 Tax=Sphingobium algorifonticola TaxID=2008318 RepID=A0A437J9H9_9SPHN|nr:RNA-binding S4 domain-containing protein [Sphingobium algorifonticola]RVT42166.1 RNA-binding S4 domain-containing protein [Sphingobium algorifonticola]
MAERSDAVRSQGTGAASPTQRIDKYLWFVRLASSRSQAQKLAEAGYMRLNGRRVDRAHAPVRPGDLITFPSGTQVRVVRVSALPHRRGPAVEARTCYEEIVVGS